MKSNKKSNDEEIKKLAADYYQAEAISKSKPVTGNTKVKDPKDKKI